MGWRVVMRVRVFHPPRLTTIAMIKPKRPSASAKISIKIIPTTKSLYMLPFTAASPITPIASPEASEDSPQQMPAANCLYP